VIIGLSWCYRGPELAQRMALPERAFGVRVETFDVGNEKA
jgi:hypothetical protein